MRRSSLTEILRFVPDYLGAHTDSLYVWSAARRGEALSMGVVKYTLRKERGSAPPPTIRV